MVTGQNPEPTPDPTPDFAVGPDIGPDDDPAKWPQEIPKSDLQPAPAPPDSVPGPFVNWLFVDLNSYFASV